MSPSCNLNVGEETIGARSTPFEPSGGITGVGSDIGRQIGDAVTSNPVSSPVSVDLRQTVTSSTTSWISNGAVISAVELNERYPSGRATRANSCVGKYRQGIASCSDVFRGGVKSSRVCSNNIDTTRKPAITSKDIGKATSV